MRDATRRWVDKAESDWRIARREVRVTAGPSWDGVCFHAQQCAEKYLKALLQEAGSEPLRTHNLTTLYQAARVTTPVLDAVRPVLYALSVYAVDVRYPGDDVTEEEAVRALEDCSRLREVIRRVLHLPA